MRAEIKKFEKFEEAGIAIFRQEPENKEIWEEFNCIEAICKAMEIEDFAELKMVDSEESYDVLMDMYGYYKGGIPVAQPTFFTEVKDTQIGKLMLEIEDGGYYAIYWKEGALK